MIDNGTLIAMGLWLLVAGVFPIVLMLGDWLLGKMEKLLLWVCDHAGK